MTLGDVQVQTSGAMVIARLTGEVDLSNAQGIGQAITRSTGHEARGVVLDLTELEYLDSAGIQLIYQLRGDLSARAQDLIVVLTEDSPPADALRLSGVASSIETRRTVEEALADDDFTEAPASERSGSEDKPVA